MYSVAPAFTIFSNSSATTVGRLGVRHLLAQIAAQICQVVVDAVLPFAHRRRQAAHVAVVVVRPDDHDVLGQVERRGIPLIRRQHLRVHGEVEERRLVFRNAVPHHLDLFADHFAEGGGLLIVGGSLRGK